MGDLDKGEMFLNFCLDPDVVPLCGVDLKPYFPEECAADGMIWEQLMRCMMSLKSSPYVCIKGLMIALELVRGNHWDKGNPFQWGSVNLNLPGMQQYDPTKQKKQVREAGL